LTVLKTGLLEFYEVAGRASSTLRAARTRFRAIMAYFGEDHDPARIGFLELQAYAKERLQQVARSTVKGELSALRKAMTVFEKAGRLKVPPFPTIGGVKNPRQGFFEEKEFRAVQAQLRPELRALAEFLYWTGWRTEECTSLLWREVDFESGWVRLAATRTKNHRPKSWPFSAYPPLKELLERQREDCEALGRKLGRVIPNAFYRAKDGRPIKSWKMAWHGARTRAGLPAKLRHDCRRTTARRMDRAGMRRAVQMRILGICTESIYRDYCISNEEDDKEEVRKLSRKKGEEGACGDR
jgi:integrase